MKIVVIGSGSAGRLVALALVSGFMTSCGSYKKTLDSHEKSTVSVDASVNIDTDSSKIKITETEITNYGDTLQGNFPLPELTDKPLVVTVASGGQTLDLSITKSGINYKSTSKATSTEVKKVQEHKEAKTTAIKNITAKAMAIRQIELQERRLLMPWYWYLLLLVLILVGVLLKKYTKPLSWLLKALKTIFKNL